MRRFRLCFAFPDDGQNCYLVPELLDKQEPDLQGEFSPKECLNFEYHYRILPEGLLPQFIVRSRILISGTLRWRSGVVLQWEDCRALVNADIGGKAGESFACVAARRSARRRLLAADSVRTSSASTREIARLEVTRRRCRCSHYHGDESAPTIRTRYARQATSTRGSQRHAGRTVARQSLRELGRPDRRELRSHRSFCCWPVQTSSRRTTATRRK